MTTPNKNFPKRGLPRSLQPCKFISLPKQEARLAQIASKESTDDEHLVKDAALHLLEGNARIRAAVREGIAQAERGEFIEEPEMDARRRSGA